jgi:hypothetical protein
MACLAVHFGKEYLAWTIRGLQDAVDEVHVFYAPEPSYGFREHGAKCPDTEEQLIAEANRFLKPGKPFFWHRVSGTHHEGMHRDIMHREAQQRGAEIYAVADADEVWDPSSLKVALDSVHSANRAARWLTHFSNFWKTFKWQLDDGFKPIRIVDVRHWKGAWHEVKVADALLEEGREQPVRVLHFGYVQSMLTMRYKFTCHSHKRELRPNWLDEKFVPWKDGDRDLHPVANNLWVARPTDEVTAAKVAELLGDHPYFGLDELPPEWPGVR